MASKKKKPANTGKEAPWIALLLVLVASAITWFPSVKNDFVNWDDIIYIMNNDMIHSFSLENISKIFSTYWMGNYHPFAILSFTFDYQFFKITPQGYHFHNMVLHLVNTALVYFFCFHLMNRRVGIATVAALLFAVHPMHVESVAWISERKDLLYTMWFLMALIAYLFYCRNKDFKYLGLSLILFLFSLLSKAQAVTLPLSLLALDYFLNRKFTVKTLAEKIPFFLLSLVFGIIAIYAQKADNSINAVNISKVSSFFYGSYGLCMYFVKLIVPVGLNCFYEYPVNVSGGLPVYVYLSPLVFVFIGVLLWLTWKKRPYIAFGLVFFLLTIFPVLQFLPVGGAVMADRYSYIPYLGLFIIAGIGFYELADKAGRSNRHSFLLISGVVVAVLFMTLSWNRIGVWKNSITLWTDVMEKNPRCVSAYINRGFIYNQDENKLYEKAILDCEAGMLVDSNNYKLYVNRAVSYKKLGLFDLSFDDLNKAIEKNSTDKDAFLDRGIMYTDHYNKYDLGIADFREFLKLHPDSKDAMFNMGVAYYKKQSGDTALIYLEKVVRLYPGFAPAYYLTALTYAEKNNFSEAIRYGNQAQSLGYALDQGLLKEWQELEKAK